jgi:alpha-tubulin suppressor-like RCC1 family protein
MTFRSQSRCLFLLLESLLIALTSFGAVGQPARAQTTGDSVLQLAAGDDHVCALLENGTVHCWGRNDYGQSGDGGFIDRIKPARVVGLPESAAVTAIDANGYTSCALTSTRLVYCWGNNSQGQLGMSSVTTSSASAVVVGGLPASVLQISVGDQHVCALNNENTVYCWGKNNAGQLGRGMTGTASPMPAIATRFGVLSPNSALDRVAAGGEHTCVLNAVGQVACLGNNTDYQIGSNSDVSPQPAGSLVHQNAPGGMPVVLNGVEALVTKVDHTCVQMRATQAVPRATMRCWGRNQEGQAGVNAQQVRVAYPVEVTAPSNAQDSSFLAHAVSIGHSCALIFSTPYCWGSNAYSKLGGRTDPSGTEIPSAVTVIPAHMGITQTVLSFALGYNFTCARTKVTSGSDAEAVRVYCWGQNDYSQIGKPKSTVETQGTLISFDPLQGVPTPPPTRVGITPPPATTSAPQTAKRRYLPIALAETGAEVEDNDVGETANTLPLNKVLAGRFDDAYDVYLTRVTTGTLNVTLFNVSATYAGNVQLLLYRGIPAVSNRIDLATLAPFTVSATGPGDYYIVVFSGQPLASQSYRLLAK